MKLVKAIKFSHLADQLTAEETSDFLNDLVSSKPKTMMKALFAHFNQTPSNADREILNDECIETISTIINTRPVSTDQKKTNLKTKNSFPNEEWKRDELPKCESLNDLPRGAIGTIASFLCIWDHLNLLRCNRSVYLDCNLPATLREVTFVLNSPQVYKEMPNLAHYYQVNELWLNLEDFASHWDFRPFPKGLNAMKRLKILGIECAGSPDKIMNVLNAMGDPLCEQITSLNIRAFDSEYANASEILCKFKNLECLALRFAYLSSALSERQADDVVNKLSELYGLSFDEFENGGSFAQTLLRGLGPKLRYLKLTKMENTHWLEGIDFSKLQQLVLDDDSSSAFDSILQTARHLRKLIVSNQLKYLKSATRSFAVNRWNFFDVLVHPHHIWTPLNLGCIRPST